MEDRSDEDVVVEVGVAVELEDAADDGNGPADEDRDELGLECMANASSVFDGVDEFLDNQSLYPSNSLIGSTM